jgi:hypothetical protein
VPFFTDTFNADGSGPPAGPTNISPNYNPAIYGQTGDDPLRYFVLDKTSSGSTSGTSLSAAESLVVLCHARLATTAQQGHRSRRRASAVLTR